MGIPDKTYLLTTKSGQPAVQSDDLNSITELLIAFQGGAQLLKRNEDGQYVPFMKQNQ